MGQTRPLTPQPLTFTEPFTLPTLFTAAVVDPASGLIIDIIHGTSDDVHGQLDQIVTLQDSGKLPSNLRAFIGAGIVFPWVSA